MNNNRGASASKESSYITIDIIIAHTWTPKNVELVEVETVHVPPPAQVAEVGLALRARHVITSGVLVDVAAVVSNMNKNVLLLLISYVYVYACVRLTVHAERCKVMDVTNPRISNAEWL